MSAPSIALPLAGLEIAINRLLALDPLTLERLTALDGRVLAVELPALGLSLAVVPHAHGLQLLYPIPDAVDVHIAGSAAHLLQAQLGGDLHGLQVDGDKHLASAFAAALREARIDWPELLVPYLGDVLTQRGVQALEAGAKVARDSADSLLRSAGEFLQYERPVLVSANEWASFRTEVRALHETVAQLERRLALVALRLQ